MPRNAQFAMLAGVAIVAGSSFAGAAQVNDTTLRTYDSVDGDFISGNGIQIDHFAQDTENGVSVAVKPRNRDIPGQPESVSGNHYVVGAGQSSNAPARPQLAFDIQFDSGASSSDYYLKLMVDFNPAVGNTNPADFAVVQGNISDVWAHTDGYFTTDQTNSNTSPTIHAWNNPSKTVISNTTNLTFLPAPAGWTYDSSATGEYQITLEAYSPDGNTLLATTTAFAEVPEPASLALVGIGGVGLLMRRRRKTA